MKVTVNKTPEQNPAILRILHVPECHYTTKHPDSACNEILKDGVFRAQRVASKTEQKVTRQSSEGFASKVILVKG
jgi:hypothetical protein